MYLYFVIKSCNGFDFPKIKYIDLPNGEGLEYPVGTMTSVSGIKSRSDGKLYPVDLN